MTQQRFRVASRRGLIVALAAATFAGVLALMIAVDDPSQLTGLLFVVPVALIAVESGLAGGLGAAAIAALVTLGFWQASGASLSVLAYTNRFLVFLVVGGLVGRLSEQRGRSAEEADRWFEMSNDMLAIASLDGYFKRLNSSWEDCLGYTRSELMARPYVEFVHPDDVQSTLEAARALGAGPSELTNFENRYRSRDGEWHWLLWSKRSDGHQIYAVAKDINDRKRVESERERLLERAEAVARTDPLTGLANRRAWDEQLTRELARAHRGNHPLAVVMLDLDNFKAFNDKHGHPAGDALLQKVSANWGLGLRAGDFLARYGGDEFGLLLPDCPPDFAKTVLERVRVGIPPPCSCSAGIAHWHGAETAEELVARADAALYAAKESNRARSSAGPAADLTTSTTDPTASTIPSHPRMDGPAG